MEVATREGGVDRNTMKTFCTSCKKPSPPARVAWIETFEKTIIFSVVFVATREGGVDRNIFCPPVDFILLSVATREGGVDRNTDSSLHL